MAAFDQVCHAFSSVHGFPGRYVFREPCGFVCPVCSAGFPLSGRKWRAFLLYRCGPSGAASVKASLSSLHQCDVDTETLRRGSPHTLVCTKNQKSYNVKARQREDDLKNRARLEAMIAGTRGSM